MKYNAVLHFLNENTISRSSKNFEINKLIDMLNKAERGDDEKSREIYDIISDALFEAGVTLADEDTNLVDAFNELYEKQQLYKEMLKLLKFYGDNTEEILKQKH
jgi:hypothetical protein